MAGKTVRCSNCGAEFDAHLTKCPYCDALNPSGAETKYMQDLWDVHRNLDELHQAGMEETKAEGKKVQRIIRNTLLGGIAALGLLILLYFVRARDDTPEKNYAWKAANFPVMDEYYETQDYDALLALYEKGLNEGAYGVLDWEHYLFVDTLLEIRQGNLVLTTSDLTNPNVQGSLLTMELTAELFEQIAPNESDEAKAAIAERGKALIADRRERFSMDGENLADYIIGGMGYYYVDFDKCTEYVKNHS